MKKLLVVLLAMLCVLTLAGCSGGSGNGGKEEPTGDGTVTVDRKSTRLNSSHS